MSLLIDNQNFDSNAEMKHLKLSKYGFGFKLKKFLSIWSWTGMTLSIIGGVASFIIIIVCCTYAVSAFPYGLFFGCGLYPLLVAVVWFCLSFFLRKKNNENDLIKVTEILKIFCYIQGTLTITSYIIVVLVGGLYFLLVSIALGFNFIYIFHPLNIPVIISTIMMIIGVALRKPTLLIIHMITSMVLMAVWVLFILGFSIYLSAFANPYNQIFGLPVLLGLLSSIVLAISSVYWNGFIVALQSIMEVKIKQARNISEY